MSKASGGRRKEPGLEDYSYSFSAPEVTPQRYEEFRRAAKLHADRHPSDPFAYARIMCHLKRGIVNADEVAAQARGQVVD